MMWFVHPELSHHTYFMGLGTSVVSGKRTGLRDGHGFAYLCKGCYGAHYTSQKKFSCLGNFIQNKLAFAAKAAKCHPKHFSWKLLKNF